jgi:hypothetical protein
MTYVVKNSFTTYIITPYSINKVFDLHHYYTSGSIPIIMYLYYGNNLLLHMLMNYANPTLQLAIQPWPKAVPIPAGVVGDSGGNIK